MAISSLTQCPRLKWEGQVNRSPWTSEYTRLDDTSTPAVGGEREGGKVGLTCEEVVEVVTCRDPLVVEEEEVVLPCKEAGKGVVVTR